MGVLDTFSSADSISCDFMLIFFIDLVNATTDREHATSTVFNCETEITIYIVVSCAVSYLETILSDYIPPYTTNTSHLYLELFKKLTSVCYDVEIFRKISTMLASIYCLTLLQMDYSSPTEGLFYEFIKKLTSPSTTFGAIRHFTEHRTKDVHPCILGEIVLKWWRVREGNWPDTTFVKELFTKIQEI